MQKSNLSHFYEKYRKLRKKITWHRHPTMHYLHTTFEIQAICRSWEITFTKIKFLGFFKIRKLRKIEGHRPPTTCYPHFCIWRTINLFCNVMYPHAKFEIHVVCRSWEIVLTKNVIHPASQTPMHPIWCIRTTVGLPGREVQKRQP